MSNCVDAGWSTQMKKSDAICIFLAEFRIKKKTIQSASFGFYGRNSGWKIRRHWNSSWKCSLLLFKLFRKGIKVCFIKTDTLCIGYLTTYIKCIRFNETDVIFTYAVVGESECILFCILKSNQYKFELFCILLAYCLLITFWWFESEKQQMAIWDIKVWDITRKKCNIHVSLT